MIFLVVCYPGSVLIAWIIPALLAVGIVGSAYFLEIDVPVTGEDGILKAATSLFTVAGGFFVAALTVLITNDHAVLNSTFVGEDKPRVRSETDPLTRKRFLSLLFGYLSFASFSIVVACLVATVYSDYFLSLRESGLKSAVAYLLAYFGTFTAFQLFLLALVGLHYLTDRLHRSDGRATFKVTPPKAD
ncbi:hypothetical protein [Qipengyuania atrilutea]|uniref:Uncharacterized protein n=1 Tax=Qipengyuania atrilutea TaxID=2744473 RepID=A0A850GWY3_9SPHN|nr:hypothetical protein [Actirhodobacter atriluteus]NVD44061.1 hypothetical protein [Actirhodobacter atriluteus]